MLATSSRSCRLFCTILIFVIPACNAGNDKWRLAIHLGNSKATVYSILGSPTKNTQRGSDSIHWFQNSGLTLKYDPDGNVSDIIVHGPSNNHFLTYTEPILLDLTVSDKIDKYKNSLGAPLKEEDAFPGDSSLKQIVWRLPPYLITVDYWVKDHREFRSGEIHSIEISKAFGGKQPITQ